MKNWIIAVVLAWFCSSAQSQVTLQFEEIKLAPLARLVLGDVARVPFVLASDVLTDQTVITIQTDKMPKSGAVAWLRSLVNQYGFDVVERGGLHYVQKAVKLPERG